MVKLKETRSEHLGVLSASAKRIASRRSATRPMQSGSTLQRNILGEGVKNRRPGAGGEMNFPAGLACTRRTSPQPRAARRYLATCQKSGREIDDPTRRPSKPTPAPSEILRRSSAEWSTLQKKDVASPTLRFNPRSRANVFRIVSASQKLLPAICLPFLPTLDNQTHRERESFLVDFEFALKSNKNDSETQEYYFYFVLV